MSEKRIDTNQITREFMDTVLIEQRLINSDEPSTKINLFGEVFDTPIMTPAFGHLPVYGENRESGLVEYSRAAKELNAVNWIGMAENDVFQEILDTEARTIRIVKPYYDKEKVFDQLHYACENGAFAVGMDIDHAFSSKGTYDNVFGEKMVRQTEEMLREYVMDSSLPFIVKGVLSVTDAALCAKAGAKGIVVSHHHGRLPFAVPPIMVLKEICDELKNTGISVFVDCSIDSGFDVFKVMAAGADAVCIGSKVLPTLEKKGKDGVKEYINKMTEELTMAMSFTNIKSVKEMDASVLWSKVTGKRLF